MAVRRWAPDSRPVFGLSTFVGVLLVAAVLALVPASGAGAHPSATAKCSSFGTTWRLSYNKKAAKAGNPIRILDACCRPASQLGVSHCFVSVTLAGTKDRGCESVDIGRNGSVAGPGKHETCPKPVT
jgi:hypothetical protein